MHTSPRECAIARTRWRLEDVAEQIDWLRGRSRASVWRHLRQLGFTRKLVERFVCSPDPAYDRKWQAILRTYAAAHARPEAVRLAWFDELTYYRQPTPKPTFQPTGAAAWHVDGHAGANTQTRLAAALDAITGAVTWVQRSHFGRRELQTFLREWSASQRRSATTPLQLFLVLDNWPVHHHPDVLQVAREVAVTLLYLPTYASWLNPIKRLWRWLRRDVLHSHPCARTLDTLRSHVHSWLTAREAPSPLTLYRVGLLSQPEFTLLTQPTPLA